MRRDEAGGEGIRIACLCGEASSPPAEAARLFSPWVEVAEGGVAFFDVRGCGALHKSEGNLAAAVL